MFNYMRRALNIFPHADTAWEHEKWHGRESNVPRRSQNYKSGATLEADKDIGDQQVRNSFLIIFESFQHSDTEKLQQPLK